MIYKTLKIQLEGVKVNKRIAEYLLMYDLSGNPIAFKNSVVGKGYMGLSPSSSCDIHNAYHQYWKHGKTCESMLFFDGITPKTRKNRYLKPSSFTIGASDVVKKSTIFTDDCGATVFVYKLLEEEYVTYI